MYSSGHFINEGRLLHYALSITKIHVDCFPCFPCKMGTGILAGSRRDLGKRNSRQPKSPLDPAANLAKILAAKQKSRRPKSCQDPAANITKILAEKKNPGGQNLDAILPRILPRLSPRSNNPGGQNLAGMLLRISPRLSPGSKFTVAKFAVRSCRESCKDWRRETKFLVRFTAGISAKF